MDASHVAGLAPSRPAGRQPTRITIWAAALVATGFFVNTALPYLLSMRPGWRATTRDAGGC